MQIIKTKREIQKTLEIEELVDDLVGKEQEIEIDRARPKALLALPAELRLDVQKAVVHNLTTKEEWRLKPLGEVAPILEAGGVFEYARKVGMLK